MLTRTGRRERGAFTWIGQDGLSKYLLKYHLRITGPSSYGLKQIEDIAINQERKGSAACGASSFVFRNGFLLCRTLTH